MRSTPTRCGLSVLCRLDQVLASRWEFLARISYIEIYNEEVRDLLNHTADQKALQVCVLPLATKLQDL